MFQDLELQRTQTVFDTVQTEEVDSAEGHWSKCSLLDGRFSEQLTHKVFVFGEFCVVLWAENASHIRTRIVDRKRSNRVFRLDS